MQYGSRFREKQIAIGGEYNKKSEYGENDYTTCEE